MTGRRYCAVMLTKNVFNFIRLRYFAHFAHRFHRALHCASSDFSSALALGSLHALRLITTGKGTGMLTLVQSFSVVNDYGCASLEANEELQSALTVPRSAMSEINDALPSHSDTTCRISRQPCIKSRGSERSRRWYSRMYRRTRSPILESLYNARPMRVLSVLSTEVHAANGGFICSHSALYPWYTG